jgi:hypothetical protein
MRAATIRSQFVRDLSERALRIVESGEGLEKISGLARARRMEN